MMRTEDPFSIRAVSDTNELPEYVREVVEGLHMINEVKTCYDGEDIDLMLSYTQKRMRGEFRDGLFTCG